MRLNTYIYRPRKYFYLDKKLHIDFNLYKIPQKNVNCLIRIKNFLVLFDKRGRNPSENEFYKITKLVFIEQKMTY